MATIFGLNGGTQFIASGMLPIFLGTLAFVSNSRVGLIAAATSLVTAAAQPIWGVMADRSKLKNRVLLITHLCIACVVWLLILPDHKGFITLLPAILILYSLVYIPMSLTDAIVVENLNKVRIRYGLIRSFSSVGSAIAAFMLFIFNGAVDENPRYAYAILFCTTLLSLIPLAFIPPTAGHARKEKNIPAAGAASGGRRPTGFVPAGVIKNKRLVLLLAYGLFTFICVGCQNTYFSMYYATDRGLNAGVGMYGLLFTVCIAAEASVMLFGNKIYGKLNIYTVFTLIQLSAFLRSLVIYFAPNAYAMFIMAIFHGHLYGMLFLRVAPHIGGIVPDEARATGQACWSVMFMGLGPVIGSALGGLITLKYEIRDVFLFTAVAFLIIAAVFALLFRRQRAVDRAEGFVG